MVRVSASINLPLHHKVHKFSSGTGSPGWSRKKGRKTVVVVWCRPHTNKDVPTAMMTCITVSFSYTVNRF